MQVFYRANTVSRFSSILNSILLSAASVTLLSTLGCGGNASTASAPPVQAPAPADPSTPQSNSGSSSSGSSSPSSGTSSSSTVPPGAAVEAAVQTLPGWDWCTAKLNGKPCASGLGNATSSLTEEQQTPSLSGKSAKFTIGGHTAYSNALWWKSFGPDNTPTHFVYDLYFYMDEPNLPEALEFDINQSLNGVRYTWGSECSYRNTGHWDIWDPKHGSWETTSAPCPVVSAQSWHHLTWQVERVNNQVHYISVTLDGNVMTIDKYYDPQPNYSGEDVNIAFQMDGDYRQDPYDVWLDNVSLSSW